MRVRLTTHVNEDCLEFLRTRVRFSDGPPLESFRSDLVEPVAPARKGHHESQEASP